MRHVNAVTRSGRGRKGWLVLLVGALLAGTAETAAAEPRARYGHRRTCDDRWCGHERPGYRYRGYQRPGYGYRGSLSRTLRRHGLWNWHHRLERLHSHLEDARRDRYSRPRYRRFVPRDQYDRPGADY
jgi:hypothetical protein